MDIPVSSLLCPHPVADSVNIVHASPIPRSPQFLRSPPPLPPSPPPSPPLQPCSSPSPTLLLVFSSAPPFFEVSLRILLEFLPFFLSQHTLHLHSNMFPSLLVVSLAPSPTLPREFSNLPSPLQPLPSPSYTSYRALSPALLPNFSHPSQPLPPILLNFLPLSLFQHPPPPPSSLSETCFLIEITFASSALRIPRASASAFLSFKLFFLHLLLFLLLLLHLLTIFFIQFMSSEPSASPHMFSDDIFLVRAAGGRT
jgi:hypothetical protein